MTDTHSNTTAVLTPDITRETFTDYAEADERTDVPAVVRVSVPLELSVTPLTAYAVLTGRVDAAEGPDSPKPYAFLLESAGKTASSDPDGAFRPNDSTADRHARFSYVGYDPEAVVTVDPDGATVEALTADPPISQATLEGAADDDDTLDILRRALPAVRLENVPERERQHLDGGLVGFLAYDAVYDLWLEEVGVERPESRYPDAQFVLNTKTLVFDELEGTVSLVFTPVLDSDDDPGEVYDDILAEATRVHTLLAEAREPETGGFTKTGEYADPQDAYESNVRKAKEHVLDGDIYQGVISRRRELRGEVDPLGFYAAMRDVNPSPYMYLLEHGDRTIVGASPETLISVRGRKIMSNPIAGTCDRGSSPVEDRRLAGEMLADDKERAEHTMLVDLARNDVRRVAEPGSVRVDEFMNVLKYSHVQHIESTVTGTLAADADAFAATRAAFPAGTLSGAPKIRAMEIIHDLENAPRGLYGGGVGYYSWAGDTDFAIVIRTATIERRGSEDHITVQAGAGLVADSDPTAEFDETEKKMGGVLTALERLESQKKTESTAETDDAPTAIDSSHQ